MKEKIVVKNVVLSFSIIIFFFAIKVNASTLIDVKLSKCVDGDTAYFIINKEEKKFRFLAIDAPESVHPTKDKELFGVIASEETCKSLKQAKKIQVEYDKNAKADKFGRELAYIYVDGVMLQRELVQSGLAKVAYIYGDYLYTEDLCKLEIEAYNDKTGIWSVKSNELGYCEKFLKNDNKKNNDNGYEYILMIIMIIVLGILTNKTKKIKI